MLNKALESPRAIQITTIPVDFSTDANDRKTLRGLDIFEDGTLTITDIDGNEVTVTFTNVAPFVRWVVQIRSIDAWDGTETNLVGLH